MKATDLAKCFFFTRTTDPVTLKEEEFDEVTVYYPDYLGMPGPGNVFIEHDAGMVKKISIDHKEAMVTVFYCSAGHARSFPLDDNLNLTMVTVHRRENNLDNITGAFGK